MTMCLGVSVGFHRGLIHRGFQTSRAVEAVLATGDPAKLPTLPEGATPQDAAAWTLVARVLLNLDETLSKN